MGFHGGTGQYGSDNGIKSSRKLAKSCIVNVEVKWMLGGAVDWGFTSVDGSKFSECNSKNNNFTKNKLDDRIKWRNGNIEEYLRILDDADKQEELEENPENLTKELIEGKLKEARERFERYNYSQLHRIIHPCDECELSGGVSFLRLFDLGFFKVQCGSCCFIINNKLSATIITKLSSSAVVII